MTREGVNKTFLSLFRETPFRLSNGKKNDMPYSGSMTVEHRIVFIDILRIIIKQNTMKTNVS